MFHPEALNTVKQVFGEELTYCDRAYGATDGADALAIVTEWSEFRNPDFEVLRRLMNRQIIVDGRNLYDPAHMAQLGFTYASVGRQTVTPLDYGTASERRERNHEREVLAQGLPRMFIRRDKNEDTLRHDRRYPDF